MGITKEQLVDTITQVREYVDKRLETTVVEVNLVGTGWVDNTYTVNIANLSKYNCVELTCNYTTITDEQLEALKSACVIPISVTGNTLTLKATGTLTGVTFPITVVCKAEV